MIDINIKPLSVNKAFKGRHCKTPECKQYEDLLWYLLPKQAKIKGMVRVDYRFFLRNHKITDGSNLIKVLEDILVKKGYIEDDRFIYYHTVTKIPSKEDRIQIDIKPYSFN
jgi:Holliday junction resolvase RusA-like endonuclease